MPMFRCAIRGENFPGVVIGSSSPIGFYTTRFVIADDAQQAEMLALDRLRGEEVLSVPPDARSSEAKVYFEEIVEVVADRELGSIGGFSFFVMGT
ncbi:MAG: hypothetical protein J0L88_15440 [Xanthomonadales bacterium]|nr:hypothetical protein [Xanthomonadales bacterium]